MTARLGGIRAITFDFGNTLVPVGRAALGRVVEVTADAVTDRDAGIDRSAFLAAWAEERERWTAGRAASSRVDALSATRPAPGQRATLAGHMSRNAQYEQAR